MRGIVCQQAHVFLACLQSRMPHGADARQRVVDRRLVLPNNSLQSFECEQLDRSDVGFFH